MIGLLRFVLGILASPFKSKLRLEAENAVLRHQLIVLRRKMRSATADEQRSLVLYPAVSLVSSNPEGSHDRPARDAGALASGLLSLLLSLDVAPSGRATADRRELRALIRQMSIENPLWGAPRIHGELLKLGIEVCPRTRGSDKAGNPTCASPRFPAGRTGIRGQSEHCCGVRWPSDRPRSATSLTGPRVVRR